MARPADPQPVDVLASDETFLAAAPAVVAPLLADGSGRRECWPDLDFRLTRDRGAKGCQWSVSGAATGTAEVWLEPWQDGTIVHLYLRLRVVPSRWPGRRGRKRPGAVERELAWKRWITGLKDRLDADRAPGCPPGTTPPPGSGAPDSR